MLIIKIIQLWRAVFAEGVSSFEERERFTDWGGEYG